MNRKNRCAVRALFWGALSALLILDPVTAAAAAQAEPVNLERSYWVHASLGPLSQRGYWGADFPAAQPPTLREVGNAARLLTGPYGANRLYLIYHKEMPIEDARRVFAWWRKACPPSVELVPALVLRMYDTKQTVVFTAEEVRELSGFYRAEINPDRLAIYDVYPNRDQGDALALLTKPFPKGLVRLGLQPSEKIPLPFTAAVQDTWSGFCHGTRNREDWLQPGFGAEILRKWVAERNAGDAPVAWNLVVVAWDYTVTERGGYPGYDDAAKNMPLPAGRNKLGAGLIGQTAVRTKLAGLSSDLFILNENSRSAAHDGQGKAFYQTLREGKEYQGYYAVPFREIAEIFRELAQGRWPANDGAAERAE